MGASALGKCVMDSVDGTDSMDTVYGRGWDKSLTDGC